VFCKGPFFIAFEIKFPSSTKEIHSTGTVDGKLISVILSCHENVAQRVKVKCALVQDMKMYGGLEV
jgi:DNA-binding protein YbaB